MAGLQYNNPLSVGNNGDFYSYQSDSNPVEAFKGLVQTIANEPATRHQQDEADRQRNMQLSSLYTTPVPDFAFRWQGDQQKQLDEINSLGTKLMTKGYDPYKNGAALVDPESAQAFKDFHQKSNTLKQTSQTAKYLQDNWSALTKSVREHPDKYQDGALDAITTFYNRPLSEIMDGGQPAPDLIQLEKPYDFKAWANKTKNAIDPTQSGHVIQRLPGAIENNFLAEWTNEPKSQRYWAKTFAELPEQQRQMYAKKAIQMETAPEYLYGLDVAKQTMTGLKNKPRTEWEVYGPGSSRTQSAQGATYRQDLVNRMLSGVPGSGEELKAITQGKSNLSGPITYFTTRKPNEIGIQVPAYTKFDAITGNTIKVPGRAITINKDDRKNAALTVNQIINDLTGEKVQPSQLLTEGGKKKVAGGRGASSLTPTPAQPAATKEKAPTTNKKSTTLDKINAMVGKPGFEGYTAKELADYYKGQGYTIK